MADLSDVTSYIANQVNLAVYPGGTSGASVSGTPIRVYEGWPIPAQLDSDLAANTVNVSIFPMAGTSGGCYQPLDRYDTLVVPVHGMTASVSGNAVTVTGAPATVYEYCTVIADGLNVYSANGSGSLSLAVILNALAGAMLAKYPSVSLAGNVLTVTGSHSLVARIGSLGVIGRVTHRQKQGIMITTWASNPTARKTVASAIEVLLSQQQHIGPLADGSWGTMLFNRQNVIDTFEAMTLYRRDLIYDVEYATVPSLAAYEVTSIQETIKDNITNPTFAN